MLGIIGAMDVEVRTIKDKMTGTVTTRAAGCDFVTGELEGVMITVVQCAPGKVNAALCTQLLIDRFQVDRVINIGVACSLSERVVIKNIVIATDVCQYDIDITALGEPKGFINGLGTIKVATDPTLSDRLARTAINSGERIHRGTVASGDTFIGTAALKSAIAGEFDALCGEMEGGAVGQVCAANGVPFAVMRAISDGGDENAAMDYPTFKKIAAELSATILTRFVAEEQTQESLFCSLDHKIIQDIFFRLGNDGMQRRFFRHIGAGAAFVLNKHKAGILHRQGSRGQFTTQIVVQLEHLSGQNTGLSHRQRTSVQAEHIVIINIPGSAPARGSGCRIQQNTSGLAQGAQGHIIVLCTQTGIHGRIQSVAAGRHPQQVVGGHAVVIGALDHKVQPALPNAFFVMGQQCLADPQIAGGFFLADTPLPTQLAQGGGELAVFLRLVGFTLAHGALGGFGPPFQVLELFFDLFQVLALDLHLFIHSQKYYNEYYISAYTLCKGLFYSVNNL